MFDGLSQTHNDDSVLLATQDNACDISTEPSLLLIPAKHFAVIAAVRSSPPPDLGSPIAADDGTVTDPDGPPDLEPELHVSAKNHSDTATAKVPADADETVADHTSVSATTIAENGVIVIE